MVSRRPLTLVLQLVILCRMSQKAPRPPTLSGKEYLVLELLVANGPSYGLQLVTESKGQLKRGTVYVTLGRMEEKGYVESEPDPEASCEACEGHHPPSAGKKFSCQRPGCYEPFVASPRCPGQKFCCALCRQALRRVLRREARWWKRLRALFKSLPPGGIGGGSAVGCGGRS